MGTKLQCTINLLAASPNSSSFTLDSVDEWDYFPSKGLTVKLQSSGLDKLQDSMDMMLEQHSIESIKKTMLMHEEIFKHQVRELHRLYSLQKMLMDELKNETQKTKFWSPMSDAQINRSNFINRHNPTIQTCEYNLHVQRSKDDPSTREQSGSCSGDNLRIPRHFDSERPAGDEVSAIEEEQAGPSSRMPPTNIRMIKDGSDEESEVELTLSIGGSSSSKRKLKSQQQQQQQQPPHCSTELLGCSHDELSGQSEIKQLHSSSSIKSDGGEQLSSSSATFEQERKRPHWLFQGLSLNRT